MLGGKRLLEYLKENGYQEVHEPQTGDVVIFLTRYGEQSEKEWYLADYYRYRVSLP